MLVARDPQKGEDWKCLAFDSGSVLSHRSFCSVIAWDLSTPWIPSFGLCCCFRIQSKRHAISHSSSPSRAPSPTKRKDRSDEKSKDRSKDKGATKESSEKDRGRDKTRKRRSASSGSSSTRWDWQGGVEISLWQPHPLSLLKTPESSLSS